MFKAVTPEIGREEYSIDISSYGPIPFNQLSPFTYSKKFLIPVPGQEGLYSHSVESIWQGLKKINGITDFSLFQSKPKKRRGLVEGHVFGDEILGVFDAREKIYKPAYLFYLKNILPTEIKEELLRNESVNGKVHLYDVEDNLNTKNSNPLAHSVFASEFLNSLLQ